MKLTKQQTKLHDEATKLLNKRRFTDAEAGFIFENWHPGAESNIGKGGIFFTPQDMAWDAALFHGASDGHVLDACAGIGVLSYNLLKVGGFAGKITCVEINPEFVRVGRKLVPDAEWVQGDIFKLRPRLKKFWTGISNPPFGKIGSAVDTNFPNCAHFAVLEILEEKCEAGAIVIIPTSDHDQTDNRQRTPSANCQKFLKLHPTCRLTPGPFDTSFYPAFKSANIQCQICDLSKEP